MKIVSLECPGCRAPLQVNSALKQAVCNYCGQVFQLEEEKEDAGRAAFADERARIDAADAIAMETAEKIRSLIESVEDLNRLQDQKKATSALLSEQEEQLEKLNGPKVRKVLWGSAAVIVGIGILLLLCGGVPAFFVTLLLGAGLVLAEYLWRKYKHVFLAGMISREQRLQQELYDAEERIKKIKQDYDLSYIPERYRRGDIMEFFCDALESKRVTTLQQAINLYEDELRHQQMYEMQQEQIRIQKEQLRTQQQQVDTMLEMEENRKSEVAGKVLGSVLSAGIGIVVGHGISKIFKDL